MKDLSRIPSSLPPAEGQNAVLRWAMLAPRMPFVWFMKAYRLLVSPLYGDVCKYYPSCSQYALDAFEVKGAVRGCGLAAWRVLRCNPLSKGGIDYVSGSVLEQRSREMEARRNGGRID